MVGGVTNMGLKDECPLYAFETLVLSLFTADYCPSSPECHTGEQSFSL